MRRSGYPDIFSGRMLQRVSIAMALACDPDWLVADEPTTALDATVQAEVVDLVLELRRRRGLGLVWITHDLALLRRVADRVAVMYAGRIVELGPAAAVYGAPLHPYAAALVGSVRSLWPEEAGPFRGIPQGPRGDPDACAYRPRCPRQDAACAARPVLAERGAGGHAAACWYPGGAA